RVVPSSPTVCYGALDPPVGGTFHFENLVMPPLPKTCPKMVLSHKGGSLCVKDVFAKKFFWCRESFRGRRARTGRKHSTEGLTPDCGCALCQALCGVSPSGQGLGRLDSERFRSTPRTWGCFRGSLSVR